MKVGLEMGMDEALIRRFRSYKANEDVHTEVTENAMCT